MCVCEREIYNIIESIIGAFIRDISLLLQQSKHNCGYNNMNYSDTKIMAF